jgi:hypothetical protein
MANNLNIGSVVSPSILKTISSSTAIKTFGDQLVNKAKEKIISVASGKVQTLKDQIQEIITLKIKVGIDHNTELKRLEVLLKEKQITQEKYDKAVIKENEAYQQKLDDLDALSFKLNEDLAKIIADPLAKIKSLKNKRKLKKEQRKNKNRAERAKARRDLAKKVAKNAAKTLAPIIALQLANQFASVLSQRAKLEELVDQVNVYIEQANTPETIAIATNLRNNAVTLINNSISKLTKLQQTIAQIDLYIAIFSAIVAVLSAIPIPTAVPPGIGIPVNVITKIVKTIEKAKELGFGKSINNLEFPPKPNFIVPVEFPGFGRYIKPLPIDKSPDTLKPVEFILAFSVFVGPIEKRMVPYSCIVNVSVGCDICI